MSSTDLYSKALIIGTAPILNNDGQYVIDIPKGDVYFSDKTRNIGVNLNTKGTAYFTGEQPLVGRYRYSTLEIKCKKAIVLNDAILPSLYDPSSEVFELDVIPDGNGVVICAQTIEIECECSLDYILLHLWRYIRYLLGDELTISRCRINIDKVIGNNDDIKSNIYKYYTNLFDEIMSSSNREKLNSELLTLGCVFYDSTKDSRYMDLIDRITSESKVCPKGDPLFSSNDFLKGMYIVDLLTVIKKRNRRKSLKEEYT